MINNITDKIKQTEIIPLRATMAAIGIMVVLFSVHLLFGGSWESWVAKVTDISLQTLSMFMTVLYMVYLTLLAGVGLVSVIALIFSLFGILEYIFGENGKIKYLFHVLLLMAGALSVLYVVLKQLNLM